MNRIITRRLPAHRESRVRRDARRGGIATLWVVLTVIMLFAFVALAVDVLFVTVTGRQLSAGADASALAGVAQVRRDLSAARDQAVALAAANLVNTDPIQVGRNDANDPAGDVVIGIYRRDDRSFTPINPGQMPNAMRVNALRTQGSLGGPMPTIFASMFGVNTVNVDRNATAMIRGDVGPAVLALNPNAPCALSMSGTSGTFSIDGGVLVVNSNHTNAACHAGKPSMDVEEVYVVGGTDKRFEDQVDIEGELITDADPIADPLTALPEPNQPIINFGNVSINNGTSTLLPGTYGNLSITGGDVTFLPGLYYITGELKVNGGNVDATAGVMLFIGPTGNIDIAGNGAFHITGMSPTVYPEGPAVPAEVADIKVPIFQSRSNTSLAGLNGTADWSVGGTIYVPNGGVRIEGTPGTFANGLIAGSIDVRGTADINIDFEGQFPPVPRKVFLVE